VLLLVLSKLGEEGLVMRRTAVYASSILLSVSSPRQTSFCTSSGRRGRDILKVVLGGGLWREEAEDEELERDSCDERREGARENGVEGIWSSD
jgi:hypothetical protein